MTDPKPTPFAMTEVESGRIHAIGHDPESQTMRIQFRGKDGPGPTYEYRNVGADLFQEFAAADSHGTFFGQRINIKDDDGNHVYPFTRLEEEKAGD